MEQTIIQECPMGQKVHTMDVPLDAFFCYELGGLVQDCFPDYNPAEREFIKTGYCIKCQKKIFRKKYTSDRIHEVKED